MLCWKMTRIPPFQTLIDQHAEAVLGFLVASVGPVDADDCFQETFVAALRGYPKLSDASNLRGWLLRIAQRKALDLHRRRARQPIAVGAGDEVGGDAASTGGLGGGIASMNGMPEVWRAVGELPPKQRLAVAHRYVCGLSYREVAELIGCSEDAARQNVRAGLRRMREEWDR